MTIIKQPVSSLKFSQSGFTLQFRRTTQAVETYDKEGEEVHTTHVLTGELELYPGGSPWLSKLFVSHFASLHPESGQIPSLDLQVEPNQAIEASQLLQTAMSTSTLVNHETRTQQVIPGGRVTIGSKLVAQLPRLQQGYETHISLLPSTENDKWVRMVWNKGVQDTYSIHDYQSPHLPSIIYRRQGTIEKFCGYPPKLKRPRLL